ncbi:MAG TPA: pentapeptide repeat-containing protein [Thermoanaerobaculia bacterium]|nr:pentapeptide repeat-containing protein [Thermoanaerobaculia bacterium]
MEIQKSFDCPWPGPVPYTESDAEQFLGRSEEIKQLLNLMDRQQLNILIALSGVGKSSLLQAGLVPALRYMREDTGDFGPALLVREWGEWAGLSESSPSVLLIHAIANCIQRLAEDGAPSGGDQFEKDIKALLQVQVPHPSPELVRQDPGFALRALVDYVRQLCAATGGLVLIIDQAEEFLGSGLPGPDQEREYGVLRIIGTLFNKEKSLKLLISLREEYLGRISLLRREVEGLDKRIFRLEPMPQGTVREVLLQTPSLTANKVAFAGDRVIDTLLRWLGQAGDASAAVDGQVSVDLLRLQALLTEVFREAQKNASAAGIVIDEDTLSDFKRQLEKKLNREISPKELARHALENYVERLLQEAEVEIPPAGPGRRLLKRVLVRMAPWLSSPGGFKRHVPENELVVNAIRDDLDILGLKSRLEEVRSAVVVLFENWRPSESVEISCKAITSSNLRGRQDLLEQFKVEFETTDESYLSGEALLHGWSTFTAATMLVRAAFEVLRLLCAHRVLKFSQGNTFSYELMHDGFGHALFEWAERERTALADTLAAVVSRRGETFRWRALAGEKLKRISWLGCNLNETVIQNVRFESCTLKGTILTDCSLENCVFDDCDLRGAVFVRGTWKNVIIRSCKCQSTLFRGTDWDEVHIESSVLENATLVALGLTGNLEIDDSSLVFSQISRFRPVNGADLGKITITDSDLQNALLEERSALLNEGCNEDGILKKRDRVVFPRPRKGPLAAG